MGPISGCSRLPSRVVILTINLCICWLLLRPWTIIIFHFISLCNSTLASILLSVLRHAVFYSAASADVLRSFKVREEELPTVYMLSEDEEGLLPYQGEILEMNLTEWVLRNSAPAMGELTFSQPAG